MKRTLISFGSAVKSVISSIVALFVAVTVVTVAAVGCHRNPALPDDEPNAAAPLWFQDDAAPAAEPRMSDGDGALPRYALPPAPDFGRDVSVHDPSIFKDDDGIYYTFGSHFAVSKSSNLMSWTQVAPDNSPSTLYGSNPGWQSVLSNALAHVTGGAASTWAPDVIKLNGKYYMYYSLSTFGSGTSFIGRVEAGGVTGPYANSVEIVKTVHGASGSPNAIDPAVFIDRAGGLWMSYGSFFGGIFIFEMETSGARLGLPKSGQGNWGTRIWAGGGSAGPEGPYIFYNPDTDYYYLMVTYGDLAKDYNMRVARSRNPDGPYADVAGRNVSSGSGSNFGNKLAGNYKFANAAKGYAALGHNSVLAEDGKYFCVYHTRFQSGADGVSGNHNQYVNQIFFNGGGWPVMAANRYAGETAGRVDASDIAGDWDVLIHSDVGNAVAFQNSVPHTFVADGSIIRQGSANAGAWSRHEAGDYYFTITIDDAAYNGVVVPQYVSDEGSRNRAALSFTGVSNGGRSMWANKYPPPTSVLEPERVIRR